MDQKKKQLGYRPKTVAERIAERELQQESWLEVDATLQDRESVCCAWRYSGNVWGDDGYDPAFGECVALYATMDDFLLAVALDAIPYGRYATEAENETEPYGASEIPLHSGRDPVSSKVSLVFRMFGSGCYGEEYPWDLHKQQSYHVDYSGSPIGAYADHKLAVARQNAVIEESIRNPAWRPHLYHYGSEYEHFTSLSIDLFIESCRELGIYFCESECKTPIDLICELDDYVFGDTRKKPELRTPRTEVAVARAMQLLKLLDRVCLSKIVRMTVKAFVHEEK